MGTDSMAFYGGGTGEGTVVHRAVPCTGTVQYGTTILNGRDATGSIDSRKPIAIAHDALYNVVSTRLDSNRSTKQWCSCFNTHGVSLENIVGAEQDSKVRVRSPW